MRHLSIKYLIASVAALLIGVTCAVGALGYFSAHHAVGLLEGVSLRDTRQQGLITNLMLRMETNRSQLLQALQHNPGTDFAKMHDHPLSVHFDAIAANTRILAQARDDFNASLQTEEARELVRKWYEDSNGLAVDHVTAAARAARERGSGHGRYSFARATTRAPWDTWSTAGRSVPPRSFTSSQPDTRCPSENAARSISAILDWLTL